MAKTIKKLLALAVAIMMCITMASVGVLALDTPSPSLTIEKACVKADGEFVLNVAAEIFHNVFGAFIVIDLDGLEIVSVAKNKNAPLTANQDYYVFQGKVRIAILGDKKGDSLTAALEDGSQALTLKLKMPNEETAKEEYNISFVTDLQQDYLCEFVDSDNKDINVSLTNGSAQSHKYTNTCDTECNECGDIRDIEHTYSGDCDDICNVCEISREVPAEHSYTNTCDTECNVCGNIRDIQHTYSGDCDSICNVCETPREVLAEHTYSGDCDSICNVCATPREALTEHTYSDDSDEECNICGSVRNEGLPFIYGDANGDEVIDGRDVNSICRYIANYDYDTETSTETIFEGADANGDGVVDGRDVNILCRYFANFDYDTGSSTVVLGPQK